MKILKELVIDMPSLKLLSLRSLVHKGFIERLKLRTNSLEVCELGFVNAKRVVVNKGVVIRKIGSVVGSVEFI